MIELMVASAVLITAISGILLALIRCLELNDISRNSTLCLQATKTQMEKIRSTTFTDIVANYHLDTFDIADVNGKGVSYVLALASDYFEITVSVSWREKNGRVFGEDTNLNGQIDTGEDINSNGVLDSPVKL
ncbi:MAG: hypothetical protein KAR20_28350, partial [Candidatus Heimdallarchaeota archaeon]|nr:hypothetical protein [Candidatus Heimdallarchaeota archaeon]